MDSASYEPLFAPSREPQGCTHITLSTSRSVSRYRLSVTGTGSDGVPGQE